MTLAYKARGSETVDLKSTPIVEDGLRSTWSSRSLFRTVPRTKLNAVNLVAWRVDYECHRVKCTRDQASPILLSLWSAKNRM